MWEESDEPFGERIEKKSFIPSALISCLKNQEIMYEIRKEPPVLATSRETKLFARILSISRQFKALEREEQIRSSDG